MIAVRLAWDPLASWRYVPLGPAGWRVGFAEAAERTDQVGEAGPAKAPEFPVFEPTDDRLIDAAEAFELSLGHDKSMPPPADELTEVLEPSHRERVQLPDSERFPRHVRILVGAAYPAVIDRLACAPAEEGAELRHATITAAARLVRPPIPRAAPVMHPSCIGADTSRRDRALEGRSTGPNGVT